VSTGQGKAQKALTTAPVSRLLLFSPYAVTSSMTSSYSSPATTTRRRNSGRDGPEAGKPEAETAEPAAGLRSRAAASSAGDDGHLGPGPRGCSLGGRSVVGRGAATSCGVQSTEDGSSGGRWR